MRRLAIIVIAVPELAASPAPSFLSGNSTPPRSRSAAMPKLLNGSSLIQSIPDSPPLCPLPS